MALVLADRVLETTGVTGTGDASLNGAQTNFQPFSVVGNGSTTYYTIVDNTNNEWEVGIGTYTSAGNKLSRDTVLSSSNGGALVYFASGTKDIFCDLPAEKVASTGAVIYKGTWNASTNTPTLTSSVGTQGDYYIVSVAGSTNLNGITDWKVGDWAIFNGSVWQKVDNTDLVTSVNGQTGAVVLTASDVGAQPAGTYVTSVSATSPVTSTGGTTPAIAMPAATTSISGYLTSTDWNTFNDKAPATSGTSILYGNGSGGFSNVTVGSGLSFTGGTLTASGGGTGDVVGPASSTDNAIARFDSTTGKLIQNSTVTVSDAGVVDGVTHMNDVDYIDFDTTYSTTLGAGQLGWNGNDTLGLGMIGGNVIQHIGEDTFFYVKASSAITKGQLCMFTGAVGSSGVLTAAPATAIPFAEAIIGVAAEDIANNGFGLIQNTGTLKGVDTSAFLDGDILYYNSAVTGGFTKTFPTSGPIVIAAAVAKSGSGGSGILTVRISFQTRVTASTGISVTQGNDAVTVTNTAPDQTVVLTGAGTTTVTGTYPSFTITSNDAYVGTVTSVGGTGSVNGITLTGTVTSSGDLTLGGTLSGIGNSQLTNSSVTVNGTTIALGASDTITAATPNALSAGTGLSYTTGTTFDGSAARTLNLADTAVTPGSYTSASITVDAQGRITAASNGSASGTVTSITAGSYLTGGTITTSGTIAVDATDANTASKVVARDASGNFSANTITANLTGNASGSAATFTSTSQNSQFNSIGVGTAGSGTAGEIRATNNVTAYYSSDSRLKQNIKDVDNALDKVCAIGSKTFDWTDDYIVSRGGEDGYFVQKSDFGVVAQDVQEVFPQAVRTREDGTLAVDYDKLATLAFGAIKELVKRVEALEAK